MFTKINLGRLKTLSPVPGRNYRSETYYSYPEKGDLWFVLGVFKPEINVLSILKTELIPKGRGRGVLVLSVT